MSYGWSERFIFATVGATLGTLVAMAISWNADISALEWMGAIIAGFAVGICFAALWAEFG